MTRPRTEFRPCPSCGGPMVAVRAECHRCRPLDDPPTPDLSSCTCAIPSKPPGEHAVGCPARQLVTPPYAYGQKSCPRCGGERVVADWQEVTMVAWSGGPEKNTNHLTAGSTCADCGLTFLRHAVIRDRNAWCTTDDPPRVIAGHATCCASRWDAQCACGQWARNRQHRKTFTSRQVDGVWVHTIPDVWDCPACGELPQMPRPAAPEPRRAAAEWRVSGTADDGEPADVIVTAVDEEGACV